MKIYYNWLLGHCNVAIKISIWILVFKIRLTNSLNIFSHYLFYFSTLLGQNKCILFTDSTIRLYLRFQLG